ncbi:DUF4440 domain-containing protein [Burkholderia sp. Ax-1719]|uniref:YybH family protein n=1 Tax=Burkholderia sp. Ax-1719 TaxID=2608334 RepID=UPI001420DF35|nr:DUF4440 domain-containing protein [Burkholderia sp. Ax-1719]NIE63110.1 DUF4440 domain-containing protein [Burkholderia sp. Ax-1719]
MKIINCFAAAALVVGSTMLPISSTVANAATPTSTEIDAAAKQLGASYDSNYAAKDADAMSKLYAEDGTLVSPGGKVIHGRAALKNYYEQRFASGAQKHHITVGSTGSTGNGGFSIADFSVEVPSKKGDIRTERGHILAVFTKDVDGWHFLAVEPSVAPNE